MNMQDKIKNPIEYIFSLFTVKPAINKANNIIEKIEFIKKI